jgi:APA family basic amino acid/polyamine antiporter
MILNDTPDRRILGLVPATAIVISSMIGTGIFTTTGLMVSMGAQGGDILLGWLIGGVIALCGALCYAEVGANFPESGGEYYYLTRLIHPAAGFIAGAISLIVGFAAPIAAAAMAMHLYMATIVTAWPVRTMAAGTILVLALLHAYDLNLGSQVQTALTAVKLLLLLAFVSTILIGGSGHPPDPAAGNALSMNPNFWTTSAFAVVLIFVSFAYSGWNAASYIATEVSEPERTLPRALTLGTGIVVSAYLLVNLSYLRSVPLADLSGVEQVGFVVATAVWGPGGGKLASTLISLTLIAPISAMLLIGPRVAEAMARDGFLPPIFARLNQRKVPSYAVMLQATLAIAIALTSSFTALLIYIGFTLNISVALTVIGLIRLRQSGRSTHRMCIGYPVPPLIFLVFAVWITIWSIQSQPVSTLAGLATIAIGYVAYLFSAKRASNGNARWD